MDWAAEIARGPLAWGPRVTLAEMVVALLLWLGSAYVLIPAFWRLRLRGSRLPDDLRARTAEGLPGDPVNLVLVGTEAELAEAFASAGWSLSDPVTLRSALSMGLSVVFDRPYVRAPVSPLRLEGRRQDLAFERLVGRSPGCRHHLRVWRLPGVSPAWAAAASFDLCVGFSHRTGQITHHIAPDLDTERDGVAADLAAAGWVEASSLVPGIGPSLGRNGGGDLYRTDGMLRLVVLRQLVTPADPGDGRARHRR